MKYTPATLTDEHIHQLQDIEQHLSESAGEDLILIAYSKQPDDPEDAKQRGTSLEDKEKAVNESRSFL